MRTITKSKLHKIDLNLWSKIARTLQKNICAKCLYDNLLEGVLSLKEAKAKATKRVDTHHIFTKGMHHSIEFDLDNAICLCFYHHRFWIHNTAIAERQRDDFAIWFLGEEKYNELVLKSQQLIKTDMNFYVDNFIRLYNIAKEMDIDVSKIVPKYIIQELLEVKDES